MGTLQYVYCRAIKLQNTRIALIKDYAANCGTITDDKADQLWVAAMKYEADKQNQSYYKKFKKILPAAKAARYFQAEHKIDLLVSASLAAEIPMVQ